MESVISFACGVGGLVVVGMILYLFVTLRRVVPTNEVHITQSKAGTKPYGRDEEGNVYIQWPSFFPWVGLTVIKLPTSIFDIDLDDYEAFDSGRLKFKVDVKGFFKIKDAATTAQRVESFADLKAQLTDICSGAVRAILAEDDLETIMEERGKFGEKFAAEIEGQLEAWGVETVRTLEFMDIRDADGSNIIEQIMLKKKSEIEKDSRIAQANNDKDAKLAETAAQQASELREEEKQKQVGLAEAERLKQVGLAEETSKQEVAAKAKETKEKEMEVKKVEEEARAEIDKNVAITRAEQEKEETRLKAEADLVEEQKKAEAKLAKDEGEAKGIEAKNAAEAAGIAAKAKAEADGIAAKGKAEAETLKQMEMAPVEAQIALVDKIGENKSYMEYLLGLEKIAAEIKVGMAKASALEGADLKVIANAGNPEGGVNSLMDLFTTTAGATQLGATLDALKTSDVGKELLTKLLPNLKDLAECRTSDEETPEVVESDGGILIEK